MTDVRPTLTLWEKGNASSKLVCPDPNFLKLQSKTGGGPWERCS